MPRCYRAAVMCAAIAFSIPILAQSPPAPAPAPAPAPELTAAEVEAKALDQKILAEAKTKSEIIPNLTYLSDMIGPRLTGSANLRRANDWTAERMKAYGLENVHLEPYEIPIGWERGTAMARFIEPSEGRPILLASAGWSPGTKGKIVSDVVLFKASKREDLAQYKGKLKNAVVLRGEPRKIAPVNTPSPNPGDRPNRGGGPGGGRGGPGFLTAGFFGEGVEGGVEVTRIMSEAAGKAGLKEGDIVTAIDGKKIEGFRETMRVIAENKKEGDKVKLSIERGKERKEKVEITVALETPQFGGGGGRGGGGGGDGQPPRPEFQAMMAFTQEVRDFLKAEGAAAILTDSNKPHGLLVTTGSWRGRERASEQESIPQLFVAHEHYAQMWRLASRPAPAKTQIEIEVNNKFIPGPVTVYNTVGEIRGSEKPDEFIVVGAHLDSWDLAQGTTDNGTGSCVTLEVARILAKCGVKPKRTIRFVLFSGEEQGLHGSRAYCERHKAELPKTSMALVHDTGTGKVLSLGLQGRELLKPLFEKQLESLKEVGFKEITTRSLSGTDHQSFERVGVPGFACAQDMGEYRFTHHTQSDTLDKANEPDLIQGAQVMAVTAMRVANLPDLLPRERRATPPKKDEPKKDEVKKDEVKKDEVKKDKE